MPTPHPGTNRSQTKRGDPRQIVDAVLLTSFSMAVAALTLGLEIQLEPPGALQF